jgi:hypothetical protein|eukprot:COSAG06_NODE_2962_length_6022_cov_28.844816_3_plen_80_part_00
MMTRLSEHQDLSRNTKDRFLTVALHTVVPALRGSDLCVQKPPLARKMDVKQKHPTVPRVAVRTRRFLFGPVPYVCPEPV